MIVQLLFIIRHLNSKTFKAIKQSTQTALILACMKEAS